MTAPPDQISTNDPEWCAGCRQKHSKCECPVTAVDRSDNGQDEGPYCVRMGENCSGICPGCASARAGVGEQQRHRIADELDRHAPNLGPRDSNQPATWFSWCDCGWDGGVYTEAYADAYRHHVVDELLAVLGGPQPDGEAEPCPVYSHGTDGWHCAVTGDHDQHTNAAGDETW